MSFVMNWHWAVNGNMHRDSHWFFDWIGYENNGGNFKYIVNALIEMKCCDNTLALADIMIMIMI